jgi:hypothetical protein
MRCKKLSGFWLNTLRRVHAGIQMRQLTCFYTCSTGATWWLLSVGCASATGCMW